MNKTLTFLSLGLLSMSALHAEERLDPTAILDKGEVDVQLSLLSDKNSYNINLMGHSGRRSYEAINESAQIRYGVGADWHIGAGFAYKSRAVTETDFSNPPVHLSNRSSEGSQNPALWASYGFINDKASPLSLSGTLLVSPNTTNKQSTIYTGSLAAGWSSSDTLRWYGTLSASTASNSSIADNIQFDIRAHKRLSDSLTIIPHVGHAQFDKTDIYSSTSYSSIGLSANFMVAANTYLIPDIIFYRYGTLDSNDGRYHQDAITNGQALKIGLYHLF